MKDFTFKKWFYVLIGFGLLILTASIYTTITGHFPVPEVSFRIKWLDIRKIWKKKKKKVVVDEEDVYGELRPEEVS